MKSMRKQEFQLITNVWFLVVRIFYIYILSIFEGRQMTDKETLGDCGVEKDSIVHLVLRLC